MTVTPFQTHNTIDVITLTNHHITAHSTQNLEKLLKSKLGSKALSWKGSIVLSYAKDISYRTYLMKIVNLNTHKQFDLYHASGLRPTTVIQLQNQNVLVGNMNDENAHEYCFKTGVLLRSYISPAPTSMPGTPLKSVVQLTNGNIAVAKRECINVWDYKTHELIRTIDLCIDSMIVMSSGQVALCSKTGLSVYSADLMHLQANIRLTVEYATVVRMIEGAPGTIIASMQKLEPRGWDIITWNYHAASIKVKHADNSIILLTRLGNGESILLTSAGTALVCSSDPDAKKAYPNYITKIDGSIGYFWNGSVVEVFPGVISCQNNDVVSLYNTRTGTLVHRYPELNHTTGDQIVRGYLFE